MDIKKVITPQGVIYRVAMQWANNDPYDMKPSPGDYQTTPVPGKEIVDPKLIRRHKVTVRKPMVRIQDNQDTTGGEQFPGQPEQWTNAHEGNTKYQYSSKTGWLLKEADLHMDVDTSDMVNQAVLSILQHAQHPITMAKAKDLLQRFLGYPGFKSEGVLNDLIGKKKLSLDGDDLILASKE
jgi:hypothetical protein